jgi:NAD(P)-dependent dehydrogenase (short-subunit alcohol dehydrogenase family)
VEVNGRSALVTGGAIGTGRAIAVALAEAGARVAVADVDEAGGEETVRRAGAGRARFVLADMTRAEDIAALIRAVQPRILVNNAGGGGHIPPHFPEATLEQWESTLSLNLLGPMRATQAALPHMRRVGEGAIVNIASTAGLGLGPYQSPEYAAAKAGLIRFTSTLGDLGGGVRVNCLVPDWVATERLTAAERGSDPPPIPLDVIAEATLALIRDDALAGRVVMIERGAAPRLLGIAPGNALQIARNPARGEPPPTLS